MKQAQKAGFTVVEVIVVVFILGILAAISYATYTNFSKRGTKVAIESDLINASKRLDMQTMREGSAPTSIPDDLTSSAGVTVTLANGGTEDGSSGSFTYENLSTVQNGVLFYELCEELISDPSYSTIHAKTGGGTASVVMKCDNSISSSGMLITGWDSRTWSVPVTEAKIDAYIASVPYDNWWTDRQGVVRSFYEALKTEFTSRGGSWPITSFWDPSANLWWGVKKETLPEPIATGGSTSTNTDNKHYCIEAVHNKYPDEHYHINSVSGKITKGRCG